MSSFHVRSALLAVASALLLACPSGSQDPLGTVEAPTFAIPEAVNFGAPLEIALSTPTGGATIHYTTDGSPPTADSTAYTAPFTISDTTTVNALATHDRMNDSAVASVTYTHRPVNLQVDNGTLNADPLHAMATSSLLYLNRFTPAAEDFPFLLRTIRIYGYTGYAGTAIRLAVYSDADGNPGTGAVIEALQDVAMLTGSGNLDWSEYTLTPPVVLAGPGDVLIGYVVLPPTEDYVQPLATDGQGRSMEASYTGTVPNPPELTPEYFAPLTWGLMIRGAN
jgi:hypothetical protein